MVKVLQKLTVITTSQAGLFLIPTHESRIMLEVKDYRSRSRFGNYTFVDPPSCETGERLVWNTYRRTCEKIKLDMGHKNQYLIKLPDNLLLVAAYY